MATRAIALYGSRCELLSRARFSTEQNISLGTGSLQPQLHRLLQPWTFSHDPQPTLESVAALQDGAERLQKKPWRGYGAIGQVLAGVPLQHADCRFEGIECCHGNNRSAAGNLKLFDGSTEVAFGSSKSRWGRCDSTNANASTKLDATIEK
jgi:hypothetical protein